MHTAARAYAPELTCTLHPPPRAGRRGRGVRAEPHGNVAGAALGALTMEAVSGSFEEAQGAEDGAEDG